MDKGCEKKEHLCETCYRATNPMPVRNECSWSGLDEENNPRFEVPEGVERGKDGGFLTCPLYISDEEGRAKYGSAARMRDEEEDFAELMAALGIQKPKAWRKFAMLPR